MNKDIFEGNLVRLIPMDFDEDIKMLTEWDHDSEFQRLLSADVANRYSPQQVKEFFEKEISSMHFFIIQRLEDGRKIGMVDLSGFNWVVGNTWVGIGIGERELWGKGYGTDAMRIALRYSFEHLNLRRVSLSVFDFNQRGVASYLKAGFKPEGRLPGVLHKAGQRYDLLFMGILRSEWEALQAGVN